MTQWANRNLVLAPVYIGLITTPQELKTECRRLKVAEVQMPFVTNEFARTYKVDGDTKKIALVVFPHQAQKERHPAQIAALFAHEATHIWQWCCELMGEDNPGDEIEAYAIQNLTQELIELWMQKHKIKKL